MRLSVYARLAAAGAREDGDVAFDIFDIPLRHAFASAAIYDAAAQAMPCFIFLPPLHADMPPPSFDADADAAATLFSPLSPLFCRYALRR